MKIIFQKKIAANGREYFQGIDDHENFLIFKSHKSTKNRELWELKINQQTRTKSERKK